MIGLASTHPSGGVQQPAGANQESSFPSRPGSAGRKGLVS